MTAQNPGTPSKGSDLRITLTAHSQATTEANPSCRPQDANIQCWGDLVLRIPAYGGLTLSGLEVHRVAVGDTACGGDEGDDSCSDMTAALRPGGSYPVNAQVNGLSVMTNPGDSGLSAGTQVQVKIALTDNGPAPYADTVDVQVTQFVPGSSKPLIYDTGPQVIQQVRPDETANETKTETSASLGPARASGWPLVIWLVRRWRRIGDLNP